MLTMIGDILNALAMGALFPLSLLPLAGLLSHGFSTGNSPARVEPLVGVAFWFALTATMTCAIWLFGYLAVDLNAPRPGWNAHLVALLSFAGFGALAMTRGFDTLTERVAGVAAKIATVTGKFALLLVFVMALVQFAVVVMRYVFGINFIFLQESVTYFHGAVFLLAGGYALLTNDHVRVDILYTAFSARRKALVDFVGVYLFLIPFALTTLFLANDYVAGAWAVREGSAEQSGIQGIYLLKALIPLFAVLLLCAGVAVAQDASRTLRDKPGDKV